MELGTKQFNDSAMEMFGGKPKQQTAVEWLYETLWKQTDFSLPNNILEQAKEMERQQIETAYNKAVPFKYGKEYYEETFKKK